MRIGIDMDDTICRTTEKVHEYLEKYAEDTKRNSLDIINDELLQEEFFEQYREKIWENAEIKRNVQAVLKRVKTKGNEIYIITSRDTENAYNITKKWLQEQDIEVDKIITAAYGEKRGEICKENHIDLMIDNDPFNYKFIVAEGINGLLFDDREKYVLKENYVTNWLDIEKYIERNH